MPDTTASGASEKVPITEKEYTLPDPTIFTPGVRMAKAALRAVTETWPKSGVCFECRGICAVLANGLARPRALPDAAGKWLWIPE